jgi:hypothetical protein
MKVLKFFVKVIENSFRYYLLKHCTIRAKYILKVLRNPTEFDCQERLGEYTTFLIATPIMYWVLTNDLLHHLPDMIASIWNFLCSFSFEQINSPSFEYKFHKLSTEENVLLENLDVHFNEQDVDIPEKNSSNKLENVKKKPFKVRTDIIIFGFILLIRLNGQF